MGERGEQDARGESTGRELLMFFVVDGKISGFHSLFKIIQLYGNFKLKIFLKYRRINEQ